MTNLLNVSNYSWGRGVAIGREVHPNMLEEVTRYLLSVSSLLP